MRTIRQFVNRGKAEAKPLLPVNGHDERSSLAGTATESTALGTRVLPHAGSISGQGPAAQGPVTITPPEERRTNTVAVAVTSPEVPAPEVSIDGWDPRKECLRYIGQSMATLENEIAASDPMLDQDALRDLRRELSKFRRAKAKIERGIASSPEYRPHPLLNGAGEQAMKGRRLVEALFEARIDLSSENPRGNHYDDVDYDEALEKVMRLQADLRTIGIDPDTV